MRSLLRIYAEKETDIFTFYDEMRSDRHHLHPPESLYPFFYYDITPPCVISEYFHKYFDFFQGTDTSFFNLFNDTEAFKRYVFYFYLEQFRDKINVEAVIKGDAIALSKASLAMRNHGDMADTFIYLFHNFEQLIEELLAYLKQLNHKMKLFHGKRKGLYQEAIDRFFHSVKVNNYKKSLNIKDDVTLINQMFAVSFMNKYPIIYKPINDGLEYSFVIGYDGSMTMDKLVDNRHVTDQAMASIFANKLAKEIVWALGKEELTFTQLSAKLNVTHLTIERIIRILRDNFAVHITRTNGDEKYYDLNLEYLRAEKWRIT